MKKVKVTELLMFIVGAELVGALSGLVSGGGFGEYYGSLSKPPLSPPGWVFPLVWGILYALMGAAAYLVFAGEGEGRSWALKLYGAQLFVNFLWSPVFFGLRSTAGAVVVIILLAALVAVMLMSFRKVSRPAAWLTLPYLIWVLYAVYLTVGVWGLER
ncbi:MAG: tryptophan-rich sensory protein [Ruminococcus sp.]|nr:tryptophan-rich sensory protein [Ruminococcus sp.]